MVRRRVRPSRGAVGGLILVGLLAVSLGVVLSVRPGPAPKATEEQAGAVGEGIAYRIVYRVEDHSRSPIRLTTQVLDVSQPHTARLVTYEGPPPGAASLGGLAWDVAHQYLIEPGGVVREIQQVPPGFAGVDAHLDVALPTALRLRRVERQGAATVAGHSCTQWLSREPLDSAAISPPTAADGAVTCVDDAGRILRDTWTLRGRLVRVRTAVSVGAGPSLTEPAMFVGVTPVPAPSGISPESVKEVPVERLASALGIPVPPAPPGLTLDRSVALIDVDRTGSVPQVVREGAAISWTDGRRTVVLLVKRGLTAPMVLPSGGAQVPLFAAVSGTDTARLSPVLSGLKVELLTSRGLLVTITGNLPEQDLLGWVRTLRLD